MSLQQVFLVTGANKGIGFEVVKKLSEKQPTDLILLGSRDPKRGEEAIIRLSSPCCSAELKTQFSNPNITENELQQLIAPLFEAVQEGNDTATVGFESNSP